MPRILDVSANGDTFDENREVSVLLLPRVSGRDPLICFVERHFEESLLSSVRNDADIEDSCLENLVLAKIVIHMKVLTSILCIFMSH